jgi:iron complex outermembrane receptor protein
VNSISTGIVGPSACTAAQLAAPTGGLLFLGGANNSDLNGDVKAAFFEFSLPVLDNFQAQLAGRYEDYGGDTGSTFDPKLSLRWQVLDGLALRGSVGTTFRGPSLTNTDPGSVTTLQSISGTFRAVRTFGNAALKPEDAFTFNVGAIVKAGGFSASLDYWSFDFDKQIVVEPVAGIVNAVFGPGGGGCTSPLITKFAFNATGCAAANIIRLDINTINGPKVKTSGVDLNAQWLFDNVGTGSITVGLDVTDVLKYDIGALSLNGVSVQPAFDAVGKLNYQTTAYPLPKWKGLAFADYSFLGIHNLRYQVNYVDSYEDQRFTAGTDGQKISSTVIHNLYYRLQLPADLTVTAAVENIADRDPSFARLDYSYDPFTGSALGRIYKVGLNKKF